MNCSEARQHLPEFLDGTLPAADLGTVNAHLAGCADCRDLFNREGRLERAIAANLRAPAMPGTVWDRLVTAIEDAERRSGGRWAGRFRPDAAGLALLCAWLAGAAALGAVALIAISLLTPKAVELAPRGTEAVAEGGRLAHVHNQITQLRNWVGRDEDKNPDLDAQIAQFLSAAEGKPRTFAPGPDRIHKAYRVNHEVLSFRDRRVLHMAFNCCGRAASIFVIPDFPEAAEMVGELGRQSTANGQSFDVRRDGLTWVVGVADGEHDVGYLMDSFEPRLPKRTR